MRRAIALMKWLNEPEWGWDGDALWVRTKSGTDYWQRTHYGFRRDNAHALVREVEGDFRMRARFRFEPEAQYDQCGLVVRANENCWFKCSVEHELEGDCRLGSVVTNGGYSDWATQDIPAAVREMSYEVEVGGRDLIARSSADGRVWRQMRVAHLGTELPLVAGIYGCSPVGEGFRFEVADFVLES